MDFGALCRKKQIRVGTSNQSCCKGVWRTDKLTLDVSSTKRPTGGKVVNCLLLSLTEVILALIRRTLMVRVVSWVGQDLEGLSKQREENFATSYRNIWQYDHAMRPRHSTPDKNLLDFLRWLGDNKRSQLVKFWLVFLLGLCLNSPHSFVYITVWFYLFLQRDPTLVDGGQHACLSNGYANCALFPTDSIIVSDFEASVIWFNAPYCPCFAMFCTDTMPFATAVWPQALYVLSEGHQNSM